MGPLWVVVQLRKYLLQCGLMFGSFVEWSLFYHEEHPLHPLKLVFLLMFLTVSFFSPFFLCLYGVFCFHKDICTEALSALLMSSAVSYSPLQSQLEVYVAGIRQPFPTEATSVAPNCRRLAAWTQFNIISYFLGKANKNLSPSEVKIVYVYMCLCVSLWPQECLQNPSSGPWGIHVYLDFPSGNSLAEIRYNSTPVSLQTKISYGPLAPF